MDDRSYWKAVADAWQDSERTPEADAAGWRRLLSADRSGRENLMTREEQEELAALPERITVYRGVNALSYVVGGLSWTLDRELAEWFGRRFISDLWPGLVIEGQVLRRRIIALFQTRRESELLILPRYVYGRTWHPLSRRPGD
jgi:hypothetical protein